ncbi:MAG TPA: sigma 54-interacting transcriptional regulator [Puia sp.]|jgi:transcriptional regulator with GAF, ATPase, and Fis domain
MQGASLSDFFKTGESAATIYETNNGSKDRRAVPRQNDSNRRYPEIIGTSPDMQVLYDLMSRVAPTNTTVLLLGETGTGKELVARALHMDSPRRDKGMIKLNCAALPPNLVESELFGHEKGSFTGATDRRIGKFELANNSTLFLDEIGEMAPDLQVKLLRAIQEREIERVGGRTTIKVDVRIIAATNRILEKEVAEGRFRRDLYYRLNVFPITIPPLRRRRTDIPALSDHFIKRYAGAIGRVIDGICPQAKEALLGYSWPGNIRELEHIIERSILLCDGTILRKMPLPADMARDPADDTVIKSIGENEREHILKVLRLCNGRVAGEGGAAQLLDLPCTTLKSRMNKLGITKAEIFSK